MEESSFCVGHHNGFQHLSVEGFDDQFDVGIKFQKQELSTFSVEPNSGTKLWYGPIMVVYVSVVNKASGDGLSTLRYASDCSRWASYLGPDLGDQEKLIDLALPHVKADLELLKAGQQPNSPSEIMML